VAGVGVGPLRVLHDESMPLGLGAQVDLEGRVPEEGIRVAVETLAGYAQAAAALGAAWVSLLATEPLRRASNRSRVAREVRRPPGPLARYDEGSHRARGARRAAAEVRPGHDIGAARPVVLLNRRDPSPGVARRPCPDEHVETTADGR
jgi:hypothetical protein